MVKVGFFIDASGRPSSGGGDDEPLRSEEHGARWIKGGEVRPEWLLSAADTRDGSVRCRMYFTLSIGASGRPSSGGGDGEPLRSEGYVARMIKDGKIRPEWMLSAANTKERIGKGVKNVMPEMPGVFHPE